MKSFIAKPQEIERKWYIIDAANKPLGRVASQAASILRGKHLPTYTPNVDCGDHVIIINAEKIVLTGNKLNQKVRYYHTGWVGGIKEIHYDKLMAEKPQDAVMYAVKGMLPNNTIGRKALTRLRVYKGAEHKHEAQKPEAWTREIK
ncbi:MAG TPA: 50S ribosomal protein L13 [Candidatus Avimonoglobus intestinipullorum]|uniref:Large ribosomal subunit protein uL13 n=1 Tax=Candidatus Avimonoglobus intestinipullorum TaxID=2840699 RepID=A0A9D1LTR2_9FIRM|nr:50S ribosomal protein L13 [Candidatus Avimonoglobus intestinipullorum]